VALLQTPEGNAVGVAAATSGTCGLTEDIGGWEELSVVSLHLAFLYCSDARPRLDQPISSETRGTKAKARRNAGTIISASGIKGQAECKHGIAKWSPRLVGPRRKAEEEENEWSGGRGLGRKAPHWRLRGGVTERALRLVSRDRRVWGRARHDRGAEAAVTFPSLPRGPLPLGVRVHSQVSSPRLEHSYCCCQ
jgi:hypothetical protein